MASTGFVLAGAGANVDRGGTSNVWASPGSVTADDASTASATVPTDYLVCSSFDFSAIPDGATIKGVTVRVQAHETGTGSSNYVPQLISATTPTLIGAAKTAVTVSGTTPTNSDSGSSSDLWSATLTSAVVKAAGFGVAIWSTDTTNVLLVDAVWISVEYQVNASTGAASVPLLTASGAGVVTAGTVTLGTSRSNGGFFYNLPPPRIGGRQPYTRRDWIPPAVPPPQVPPRSRHAVLGIILTAWLPQSYQLPPQVKIAPLIPLVTTHVGTGAASLLLPTASGAGDRIGKATGAPSVPVVTASGIGRRTLRSVGAPLMPLQTATGAATKASKGSGTPSLPLLTASGESVVALVARTASRPAAFGVIFDSWRTSYDLPPRVEIAPLLPIAATAATAGPLLAPAIFGILSHWRAAQDRPPQVRIAPLVPIPAPPPVRTWATFGVIRSHWVPTPYDLPKPVQIAPLVPIPSDPVGGPVLSRVTFGVIVSTWHPQRVPRNTSLAFEEPAPEPPPLIDRRSQLQIIDAVWREDPVVVISLASSAPLLVAPPDKPMQDRRQFDLIVRAWEPKHPRQRERTAAQFPLVNPPPVSSPPADRRTQEIIRRSWEAGPPRQREQKPEVFPRVDAAPLIDRRQHALIIRAWEPYQPRQREKSSALFPRVDVAPLKLRTNYDIAVRQWTHIHPLLQQRKLPPPSGAPDPAVPYAGKTSKGVGIYRKDWDYRDRRAPYIAPTLGNIELSVASFTLTPLPWTITGTPVSSTGTASLAPIRRTGVYRKTWNYAERNAIPEIFWFEQFPSQTVGLTTATLSFTALPWAISTTSDYLVTLSRPTLSFTALPWTIVAVEDYLETFTTALLSFNALPWSINTIGQDVVNFTRPTITFTPLRWTISGATTVTNLSLARLVLQSLSWEIVGLIPGYFTPAEVTVRAFRDGHFDGLYRTIGDTFDINDPVEFSPYWMTLIDMPPNDWIALMDTLDPLTNRQISWPLRPTDTTDWVDTGIR